MNKLRRRRADRCTFPIEMGFNGEAGVTNRGGADSAGWGRKMEICSDWNIVLNVPTGTFVPATA
jgi:hypothetical protein